MTTPASTVAVLIARVSSKGQEEEGFSLEAQVKILKSYCGSSDLRIGRIYKIAESASKSEQRKIFKEAMDYVENHKIKNLVVEKVDRHVRNLHDAVDTYDWLTADEERRVHFVKDSLVMHQKSRSQEWLNWGIRVVMAKNYIDNLREETMKGTHEKLAQGWLPGTPPPGYKHVIRDGKKVQDFDPNKQKSMQRIFQLFLEPGQSIDTIRHKMFEFGLTTASGRMLVKNQAHRLLKNPYYIGIIQWDGKEYPGKHPHLISDELFYAVQAKLTRKTPEKLRKHNPVLKGIMVCEHCGKMITWQKQKGRLYGACQRKTENCKKQKFVREDAVMGLIEDKLDDLICPAPQVVDWLVTLLKQDFQLSVDNTEQAQKALDDRIARIRRMDDMLYDDKLAGLVSAERYQTKHDAFVSELNGLERQKGGVSQKYEDKYMKGISDIELSQEAKRLFADANVTNDDKRVILTKLFEKISLKDSIVSVTYTKLAQAIALRSGQTKEILGYAQ
ncbi:MAG TPA: recombinase family protein [Candidatus Saccharimonadales bacterium]|nr:recombinase family protein [Candidatus Saccharimonadales bacterium]